MPPGSRADLLEPRRTSTGRLDSRGGAEVSQGSAVTLDGTTKGCDGSGSTGGVLGREVGVGRIGCERAVAHPALIAERCPVTDLARDQLGDQPSDEHLEPGRADLTRVFW